MVWLNELRHYADAEGGTDALARLTELLGENSRIIVITSLWPEFWKAYTADNFDRPGSRDPAAATRGLLRPLPDLSELTSAAVNPSQGGVIDVPGRFTHDDLTQAHQCHDPIIEEAIKAAHNDGSDGEVTQYLAGVPDLLNHYGGRGADPYGQAVITAAMDAARLGRIGPYPAACCKVP